MRAGIVNDDQIADINVRQWTIDGEFIVVFAQGADDVVNVIVRQMLLAGHGDVVVRAIHRRTHQVDRAGVQTDVFLVDVLFVDGGGHQTTVGAGHVPPQFAGDVHLHAGRRDHALVKPAHIVGNFLDVRGRLLRAVGNADAAGEVDHEEIRAHGFVRFHGQFEKHAGDGWIIAGICGIAGQERVQAELLDALALQHADGLENLRARHAVFGVPGMPHAGVANVQFSAGIVAQADLFRDAAVFLKELYVGDVVEVDDRAQFARVYIILGGRHVGRKHDFLALEAHGFGQHQFRDGGAIHAAALAFEHGEYIGIRIGLDGEMLAEARVPGKRRLHATRRFADALFIVEVEGRGVERGDLVKFFGGTEGQLLHKYSSLHKYSRCRWNTAMIGIFCARVKCFPVEFRKI